MPRFTIAGWFGLITVIAMALAGSVFDNSGLLQSAWFFVFAVSLFAVLHSRGRQRAFWLGPFLVLILESLPNEWPLAKFAVGTAHARLAARLAREATPGFAGDIYSPVYASAAFMTVLIFGFIAGLLSVRLYTAAREKSN